MTDRALSGTLLGAGLCAATALGAFGPAALMLVVFPLAAVVAAGWLLVTQRSYAYLGFAATMWLVAPAVRRIVDWQSTYHDFSPVNAVPALVSLMAVPWVLRARRRLHHDVAWLFVLATVVMAYALAVGVVRNGVVSAAADVPLIVAPLVLGLFVLMVPDDDARVRAFVAGLAVWGAILLGGYAVVQFQVLPPWDEAWMVDSGTGNLGEPVAGEFRTFSTLGTASYLAQVLCAMLLVLVAERRLPLQLVAGGAALAGLGLTLSRQGWLALVVGLLVLVALRRLRAVRLLALAVVLFVVLMSTGSPIVERITDRFEETRTEGTEDTSLVDRYWFQYAVAPDALRDLDGSGMGATGRAALVSGGSHVTAARYVSFDSGVFESLVRYGSVGGLALLGSLVVVAVRLARRSRRGTVFDAACAAAVCALTFGMLFQDTQRGAFGVMLWTLLAVQGRASVSAADSAPEPQETASGELAEQPVGR
ncbi:O-antigen ligase family protein [Nocardioides sp.]|uniref:O-antigen ligase family protein n=1 Tax=Nocardioides sp. TaxID=35761 RepID=UPI001A24E93C|nr:O-antigen ligase family protein [Nocardioides sp.]MBJ7357700.1 hypothetical protein [Nocardioides sp.]